VEAEVELYGGRITAGVVRVGEEVRRPLTPNSDFTHLVLGALEAAEFAGAPRFLGMDERGRERLSYLPGWVAPDLAHGDWSDEQLVAAVELVRRFHDVLAGSELAGGAETVCHNDLGPCNTVHVNGVPRAFIDWDGAAPGPRVLDLAHAIWRWAIISDTDELPLDEQVRRVRLMGDSYGGVDTRALLDAVTANQSRVIDSAQRRHDRATSAWHGRERAWFALHRDAFALGLR
jgi:aminoglycoside phosphotransferase (APT) family kinase protein